MEDGAVYPEASLLVGAAESIWNGSDVRINIGIDVSAKLVKEMRNHLPEDLSLVFITDSDIRHIMKRHGQAEELRGQTTIIPQDFAHIPIILNEFETCEYVDTDKLGNKKFLLSKNIEGNIFLITIQRGKRKLEVKTMWKESRSGASC